MAYLTVTVEESDVLQMLEKNHGLVVGDMSGRCRVEFGSESANGGQTVEITLTYQLSEGEVSQLLR